MKRIKLNYHALHVRKSAQPKLRIDFISNIKELVNYISECDLHVLNGNITMTVSNTRKFRKHKVALCKLIYRHVPLSGKYRIIVQRGGSSTSNNCRFAHAR